MYVCNYLPIKMRNRAGPASWCLRKGKDNNQSEHVVHSLVHGISSTWTKYSLFTVNNTLFWFYQHYISMGHGLFATHQIFHWTTFLQEAWNFYHIIMDLDLSGHLACTTPQIHPTGVTSAFVPHSVGHRVIISSACRPEENLVKQFAFRSNCTKPTLLFCLS